MLPTPSVAEASGLHAPVPPFGEHITRADLDAALAAAFSAWLDTREPWVGTDNKPAGGFPAASSMV